MNRRYWLVVGLLGCLGLTAGWQIAGREAGGLRIVTYSSLITTASDQGIPPEFELDFNEIGPDTYVFFASSENLNQPGVRDLPERFRSWQWQAHINAKLAAHLDEKYLARGWRLVGADRTGAFPVEQMTFFLVPKE